MFVGLVGILRIFPVPLAIFNIFASILHCNFRGDLETFILIFFFFGVSTGVCSKMVGFVSASFLKDIVILYLSFCSSFFVLNFP